MNKWTVLLGAGLLTTTQLCAADDDSHGHSHKAHTHGIADLTLVREGEELQIQFESPTINILGFERAAKNEEEEQVIVKAKKSLESAEEVFSFPGNVCRSQESDVSFSGAISEHNHTESHDDHEDEHSEHEHEHEHEEHSGDDEHAEHEHESKHSEVTANYRFTCEADAKLMSVSTMLPKLFPGIEKINVSWINEAKQGATDLHGDETEILLK